jgi:hypothetical protein
MKTKITLQITAIIAVTLLAGSCRKQTPNICNCEDGPTVTVKVFATGLNNPRGLKFGPDENLYVAEGGKGGTNSTIGQCSQVPAPVGPYTGSPTGGGISIISPAGVRTVAIDNLPSATSNPAAGGDVVGVGDVAFIGNVLYALITGGGCSHGVPSKPNGVYRIPAPGQSALVANLSTWIAANPVKSPNPGDFEPDGDWYSMINAGGNFFAVEANHGQIVKITPGGEITRVVDISAALGHIVPTVIAYHEGNFYVGNLNPFPIVAGSSNVYKITAAGDITIAASGFSTILGITFDNKGRLVVLENTTGQMFPTPGTGRITRVKSSGDKEIIATGLSLPTGITYGPDGKFYVSNWGFGPTAIGGGQILQVTVEDCKCDDVYNMWKY